MKKYLLVLFVLSLLFVFSGSVVSAQTDNVSPEYSYQAPASVKPVGFWDKIKLFFTFDQEEKVELLQKFSGRNFETAKEKISQQKPEKAKVLLEKADKDIKKAADVVSKFENKKKQQEALNNISTITSNRAEILSRVLEQVKNPVAQQAITSAIEKQSEIKSNVNQRINVLLNKIAELEAEIKQLEQEKTGTQVKTKDGSTTVSPPTSIVPVDQQATGCQWKDASTLTNTDGSLGQTCLAWAQSFAGSSITANKLRFPGVKDPSQTLNGSCAYEKYTTNGYSANTAPKSASYSSPSEKPIRDHYLLPASIAATSNIGTTQICVPLAAVPESAPTTATNCTTPISVLSPHDGDTIIINSPQGFGEKVIWTMCNIPLSQIKITLTQGLNNYSPDVIDPGVYDVPSNQAFRTIIYPVPTTIGMVYGGGFRIVISNTQNPNYSATSDKFAIIKNFK